MPIYEYRCGCGHRFEELQPLGAAAPGCPACGRQALKVPSRVSLGNVASPGPGPADAPHTWEQTGGGDRETIRHWQRQLDARARLEEKHPELAGDRRPVLAHEGRYARNPLRAGDPPPPTDPGTSPAASPGTPPSPPPSPR